MANTLTPKQAKNIQKHLRLARALEGTPASFKHYSRIEKLLDRYGIVVPDMKAIDFGETMIDSVNDQRETRWNKIMKHLGKRNVFYRSNELWGWRFYLKAILHFDYLSLYEHVKRMYFTR